MASAAIDENSCESESECQAEPSTNGNTGLHLSVSDEAEDQTDEEAEDDLDEDDRLVVVSEEHPYEDDNNNDSSFDNGLMLIDHSLTSELKQELENAMNIKNPVLDTMYSENVRRNCPHCEITFYSKRQLCEHLRDSHGVDKPFQCEVCFARFPYSSSLYNHTRIHSELRPFKCNLCDSAFRWKNSLKHHKRYIHKDEDAKTDVSVTFAMAAREKYGTTALDQVVCPPYPKISNHSLRRLENFSNHIRRSGKPPSANSSSPFVRGNNNNNHAKVNSVSSNLQCEAPDEKMDDSDSKANCRDHYYANLFNAVQMAVAANSSSINNGNLNLDYQSGDEKTVAVLPADTMLMDKKKRKKQMVESIVKKLCITNSLVSQESGDGENDSEDFGDRPAQQQTSPKENSKTMSVRPTLNNGLIISGISGIGSKSDEHDQNNATCSDADVVTDAANSNSTAKCETSKSTGSGRTCGRCLAEFDNGADLDAHLAGQSCKNVNSTAAKNSQVAAASKTLRRNTISASDGSDKTATDNLNYCNSSCAIPAQPVTPLLTTTPSSCEHCQQLSSRLVTMERRLDVYQRFTDEKIASLESTITDLYEICANNGIVL